MRVELGDGSRLRLRRSAEIHGWSQISSWVTAIYGVRNAAQERSLFELTEVKQIFAAIGDDPQPSPELTGTCFARELQSMVSSANDRVLFTFLSRAFSMARKDAT